MPIDNEKFVAVATRGELAGVAITTSLALDQIVVALLNIKNANDIDKSIGKIRESIRALDKTFDELTGWTSDGS